LEHQQNMPLTFLASKELISNCFIVLDVRKVGAVVKSLILTEKCSLSVLAAADIPALQPSPLFSHPLVFQTLLVKFQI